MLESAESKELKRIRRIESAEGLADLFFRADSVRSAKEDSSTDNLRRTYRNWRTGSSDVHAHPDVLTFHHAATTDEQRSTAKMKRVKTTGDRLDEQMSEDLRSWSRPGSTNGTPRLTQVRVHVSRPPTAMRTACRTACHTGPNAGWGRGGRAVDKGALRRLLCS